MLLVQTCLCESSIQGIGLFAGCDISRGEVIWKYDRETTIEWSRQEWEEKKATIPSIAFENIARFAYLRNDKWLLNLDDSRFMNHSFLPNMGYDHVNETCFALRHIKKGEELTIKYDEFCEEGDPDLSWASA